MAVLSQMQALKNTLGVYLKRRVLIIFALGFSAGLPLALSGSTLTIWMFERGVDLTSIGLYALIGIPYSIKFLWAPIVDAWRIPFLSDRLGRRRGWLIFSQLILMAAVIFLGSLDPIGAPYMVAFGATLVATMSATQDIVIDAFRVEALDGDEQGAGMAYYVSAYRIAMLVSTAGVIAVVAILEDWGVAPELVWFYGYAIAAGLILIGVGAVMIADEPVEEPLAKPLAKPAEPQFEHSAGQVAFEKQTSPSSARPSRPPSPFVRFADTSRAAFSEFFAMRHAVMVLIFVVLFKFCDALAGVMTGPFVLDIGFDKTTYATVVKGVGLIAALVGGFIGGLMVRGVELGRALLIGGVLQMLSNLVFCLQASVGAQYWVLVGTILVENFTGAIGTVIFVAYLSALCGHTRHTATQYALLTALAAVGRTTLSASSGYLASEFGWMMFFGLTAIAALPGLALLIWLKKRGHFYKFDAPG